MILLSFLFSVILYLIIENVRISECNLCVRKTEHIEKVICPQKVRQKLMVMQLIRIEACIAQDSVLLVLP